MGGWLVAGSICYSSCLLSLHMDLWGRVGADDDGGGGVGCGVGSQTDNRPI